MSDIVIRAENLGKKYRIRHQTERVRYTALRDVLAYKLAAPWRTLRRAVNRYQQAVNGDVQSYNASRETDTSTSVANASSISDVRPQTSALAPTQEDFWALKEISFEIRKGEVVGIIGRNGAGKSTLLKILSQITEPTEGRVCIRGRVASLLEVGTGFHSELTGRENIFLNGAILGMTRLEIRRKFDEIVDFAEVQKFLDTPVKRYSSGMYVRLAFAVAAHLEPEILVVDEVLAVGDAEFQRKCLGKMSEVAQGGRTVLFVSHNIASLSALCDRGIVLHCGRKQADGRLRDAVENYLTAGQKDTGLYESMPNGKPFQIVAVSIPSLAQSGIHVSGKPLRIRVVIRSDQPIQQGCLSIQVTNYQNTPVLHFRAYDRGVYFGDKAGESILECVLSECWLNVGPHRLNLYLSDPPGDKFSKSSRVSARLKSMCTTLRHGSDGDQRFVATSKTNSGLMHQPEPRTDAGVPRPHSNGSFDQNSEPDVAAR